MQDDIISGTNYKDILQRRDDELFRCLCHIYIRRDLLVRRGTDIFVGLKLLHISTQFFNSWLVCGCFQSDISETAS